MKKAITTIMLILIFFARCSSDSSNVVANNNTNESSTNSFDSASIDSTAAKELSIANSFYSIGDYQKCIDYLNKLSNNDTTYKNIDQYWYLLGKANYQLSNLNEAKIYFSTIENNFTNSKYLTNSIYFLARIYQKKLDLQTSNSYYQSFFNTLDAKSSTFYNDAHYFYASLNYDLGNYNKSKNLYNYFYSNNQNSLKTNLAQYFLARSYDKLKINDSAQIHYKVLINKQSSDTFLFVNSLYYNGFIDYSNNLYSVAKDAFKTIITKYPNSYHYSDALYYYAKCLYNDSTLSKISIIPDFQKVLDLSNDKTRMADAEYYIGKCYYYAKTPNYKKSLLYFQQVQSKYPQDTARVHDAIYWEGKVEYMLALTSNDSTTKLETYKIAKSILTKYLSLQTNDTLKIVDAKYRVGTIDYYFGNYREALTIFDNIINNFSTTSKLDNAIYYKGKTLYKQKDYTNSISILNELIKNFSNSPLIPDARFYSGLNYYYTQDYLNAQSNLQTILETYPHSSKYSSALYWLGKTLYMKADYYNAKSYFTQYTNDFPNGYYYQNAQDYITKCNTQLGI